MKHIDTLAHCGTVPGILNSVLVGLVPIIMQEEFHRQQLEMQQKRRLGPRGGRRICHVLVGSSHGPELWMLINHTFDASRWKAATMRNVNWKSTDTSGH